LREGVPSATITVIIVISAGAGDYQTDIYTSMSKKVLVTGAAGFIGRSLVKQLLEDGYHVTGLDNFRFSNQDQIQSHPNMIWVTGDTRDWELVSALVANADHVIHLAAPSSFLMHEENDLEATTFAMMGFKTLMEALRKHDKNKIVWASTSAVYEEWAKKPRVPFHEELSIDPPDSKAGCKWWCEQEALRYSNRYGITSVAFRPFSVYGVGEHTKLGYANVTSLFTWAMMSGHQPVVWGDGMQTRDFIFVEDVARAFKIAIEKDDLPTCALNLGFGIEHTFLDAIDIIAKELGVEKPEPIWVDVPIQIYAQRLWADMSKTEAVLGFKPTITLQEGVRRIIEATKSLPQEAREKLKLDVQQHYYEKLPKRTLVPLT
jgi:UDP-glucose 4-epimerase